MNVKMLSDDELYSVLVGNDFRFPLGDYYVSTEQVASCFEVPVEFMLQLADIGGGILRISRCGDELVWRLVEVVYAVTKLRSTRGALHKLQACVDGDTELSSSDIEKLNIFISEVMPPITENIGYTLNDDDKAEKLGVRALKYFLSGGRID